MTNHYHLVIETPDGNLSKGMRQLNGVFTQNSNRRHHRSGHLFQGRYKAILVDADAYLMELTRYVVLNPVRAGMVKRPGLFSWSSYNAMIGEVFSPVWLATDGLLTLFAKQRKQAIQKYSEFVKQGVNKESIWNNLNRQVFLGDDKFIIRMQEMIKESSQDINIPKAHRRPPAPSLEKISGTYDTRNKAIVEAYATGEYSYQEIGTFFNLHFSTIGKIVRAAKEM